MVASQQSEQNRRDSDVNGIFGDENVFCNDFVDSQML